MAVISVASTAELSAALSSAQGGDRIELAGGDYGSVFIQDTAFSSDVTIVSADLDNLAVFDELLVQDSTHIVFESILFDYVAEDGDRSFTKPFWIRSSTNITIRNSVFDGSEVPSSSGSGEFGLGYGLYITDSETIVIESNEFFNFTRGIVSRVVDDLVIRANDMHSFSSDGINLNSVDGALVEGNWIHDFKVDPSGGAHADMIQIRTTTGEISSRNIVIRDNFFDAGTGTQTQTIFGNPGDEPFQNILIEVFKETFDIQIKGFFDYLDLAQRGIRPAQ